MPWCCSLKSPPSDMCHSLLLCFLFLISFAEMENSITERIWFVTVRCLLFRLRLVGGGGGMQAFFPPDFCFFKRQCDCICVRVWLSHHPPLSFLLKKKGIFSSKKSREWENDKSLGLCYWNILTALGSLTFYYRR